jgi:hypothetical protein
MLKIHLASNLPIGGDYPKECLLSIRSICISDFFFSIKKVLERKELPCHEFSDNNSMSENLIYQHFSFGLYI